MWLILFKTEGENSCCAPSHQLAKMFLLNGMNKGGGECPFTQNQKASRNEVPPDTEANNNMNKIKVIGQWC